MTTVGPLPSSSHHFEKDEKPPQPQPQPQLQQSTHPGLEERLKQLEQIHQREVYLLTELRKFFGDKTNQEQRASLEIEIKELLRKKEETVTLLFEVPEPISLSPILSTPSAVLSSPATISTSLSSSSTSRATSYNFTVVQQPSDIAIANRYLSPSPTVRLAIDRNLNLSDFVATVALVHQGTDQEVSKTVDGRQEVLQGVKKIYFDSTGKAVFGKLKIVEVSSKHRHQAFCLLVTLEEQSRNGTQCKVVAQTRTTPFHVQSRPNKRKLSSYSEPSSPKDDPSPQMKRVRSAESFHPVLPAPVHFSDDDSDEDYEPARSPSIPSSSVTGSGPQGEGTLLVHDYNYVDITDLLVLPQKEAAKRLGISESMLCKRFKECTRRKWPYRYLRKIDKVINILNLHKSYGVIPKEDKEKLERLTKERDECLRPVKIRITACDKLPSVGSPSNLNNVRSNTTHHSPSPSPSPSINNGASSEEEEDDENLDDILETLGKMKSQPCNSSP